MPWYYTQSRVAVKAPPSCQTDSSTGVTVRCFGKMTLIFDHSMMSLKMEPELSCAVSCCLQCINSGLTPDDALQNQFVVNHLCCNHKDLYVSLGEAPLPNNKLIIVLARLVRFMSDISLVAWKTY